MNDRSASYKRKAIFSLFVGTLFLVTCFTLGSLGTFVVWAAGGTCAYFFFLTGYYFFLSFQAKQPFRKGQKETPQQKELKAYIRSQIPMLISIFLFGILVVVIVFVFFA